MHELLLIPLFLLGQAADGSPFGDVQASRPFGHSAGQENSRFPPPPPLTVGQTEATPFTPAANAHHTSAGPNVGQQLSQPQTTYVAPASATLPSDSSNPTAENFTSREPLPLARQGQESQLPASSGRAPPSIGGTIINIVSSLAIVLGLFFLVAWFMRRGSGSSGGALPSEVVQVLGKAALSPRQQMQLLRVGEKLVLVAISPGGVQTLTEVTDPREVERMASACEGTRSGSASESFREVLSQLGNQPAIGGFFGGSESSEVGRSRRGRTRAGREDSHA